MIELTGRVTLGTFVPHPLSSPMCLVLWLNFPKTAILGWFYGTWADAADLGRINDPIVTGMTRHPHPIPARARLKVTPQTLKLLRQFGKGPINMEIANIGIVIDGEEGHHPVLHQD